MSQSLEQDVQNWDNFQNDIIQFGNYLQAEQCTRRTATTETKWSMPLPTRSGCQAQVEPSSRAASRPVLV